MATDLPYLPSYKNVGELFQRIGSAKKPESFTTNYLADTLGLKSSGDRALIALLKALGFLDSAGRPTSEYDQLKNPNKASKAIGEGVRRAYEGLFSANENVNTLPPAELRGLISQVAGSDSGTTAKIQGTFAALVRLASFGGIADSEGAGTSSSKDRIDTTAVSDRPAKTGTLRPEFHYNIQVHLPSNASEETYLSIFNALRKAFEA